MPPSWPSDLPQEFERNGYRDALPDQTDRSDIRVGAERLQRRPRREKSAPIAGAMLMTTDQWDDLLEFFEDDVGNGALVFDFPNPDDTSETIPVAFASVPRLSTLGGGFHRVNIALERQ